jgi:hypothetical protein
VGGIADEGDPTLAPDRQLDLTDGAEAEPGRLAHRVEQLGRFPHRVPGEALDEDPLLGVDVMVVVGDLDRLSGSRRGCGRVRGVAF